MSARWTILISAGVGPIEVRHFVALLAKQLAIDCVRAGVEVCSITAFGDENAPRSVEIDITGDVPTRITDNIGTHVLVARSQHRGRRSRKRWFAGVSLHPTSVARDVDLQVNLSDIEITTMRASGPGGQHINTTDSAVRIRHKPSGICVRVTSERSQHRNRAHALARLTKILKDQDQRKWDHRNQDLRLSHYSFERGHAVKQWSLDRKQNVLQSDDT